MEANGVSSGIIYPFYGKRPRKCKEIEIFLKSKQLPILINLTD